MLEEKDNLTTKNKEKWTTSTRISSGLQRIVISLFIILSGNFFGYLGYKSITMGASGEWKILAELKGFTFYLASFAPGIFFCLVAGAMIVWGLKHIKDFR